MRAIHDINAPKELDLSWRLQSLANMAKQKIGPLLGFSGVLLKLTFTKQSKYNIHEVFGVLCA